MRYVRTILLHTAFGLAPMLAPEIGHATEFAKVCQAGLERKEALVAECRKNARSFNRNFFPGGRSPPVAESFAIWFDGSRQQSRFALGCALLRGDVNFLGVYFTPDPSSFLFANAAEIAFVDFQGNVGLKSPDGRSVTLLAIHKLTPPLREEKFPEKNCRIGSFDNSANLTTEIFGTRKKTYKVQDGDPALIETCSFAVGATPEKSQCVTRPFKSAFGDLNSAIIYGESAFTIAELGRVYVHADLWIKTCEQNFRSAIEVVASFVKELCTLARKNGPVN